MKTTSFAVLAVLVLPTGPQALAADREECEAAIRQAQDEGSRSALLQDNEGRADEFRTALARAGEAGEQGDFARCLTLVSNARGAAGLREQ